MRRGRIFFYLAFILILVLVAVAVVVYRLGGGLISPPPEVVPTPTPIEMVNVVVVTQNLPRGNLLDETVLAPIPIPRDSVIEGYFTDLAAVVGRRARVDLEANMLLTSGMVTDTAEGISETGSDAALMIPKGMVAVSIPIDKVSDFVAYAIRPGDHVNVIVSLLFVDLDPEFQTILPNQTVNVIGPGPISELGMESLTAHPESTGGIVFGKAAIDPILEQTFFTIPSEVQRPRLVSQSLLQDAIVLGVGTFPLPEEEAAAAAPTPQPAEVAPAEGVEPTPPPPPPVPKVVTLIVTPQDAVTLNYLLNTNAARISLALRAVGDDTRVQTEAATLDFLLKQYNIPVPVKLPYGTEPRVNPLPPPPLLTAPEPTPAP